MIQQQLEQYLTKYRATLLGIGPMSLNCIDASIELANDYGIPLMFVASRRQIDSEVFGGGYVNNWTTDQFSRYVNDADKKRNVLPPNCKAGSGKDCVKVYPELNKYINLDNHSGTRFRSLQNPANE